MAIRILTDSTSDILPQEARERGLLTVPLRVHFGEEVYQDGVDITHGEFYEKLARAKQLPTTSQPTPEDFLTIFQQMKEQGDTVICILLASKLSGTVQSAQIAKDLCEYENIYVADSCEAIIGLRLLVDLACMLAEEGKSAPEIVAEVERARERVRLFAIVDTLEYLHKGGRLPGAVTVVGTLMKVKPLITLRDSELGLVGKGLGVKDGLRSLVKLMGDDLRADPRLPLYFGYTSSEDLCRQLKAQVTEKYQPLRVQTHSVGAVVGAHVGPGAAAVAYLERE